MRCVCCDRNLNDFESTRKSKITGDYLDMCNKCYSTIKDDVATTEREDADPNEITDEDIMLEADSFDWEELGYNNED